VCWRSWVRPRPEIAVRNRRAGYRGGAIWRTAAGTDRVRSGGRRARTATTPVVPSRSGEEARPDLGHHGRSRSAGDLGPLRYSWAAARRRSPPLHRSVAGRSAHRLVEFMSPDRSWPPAPLQVAVDDPPPQLFGICRDVTEAPRVLRSTWRRHAAHRAPLVPTFPTRQRRCCRLRAGRGRVSVETPRAGRARTHPRGRCRTPPSSRRDTCGTRASRRPALSSGWSCRCPAGP
jgi:hypothetical protein